MHALFDIVCVFALGFFASRMIRSRRHDHVPRLLPPGPRLMVPQEACAFCGQLGGTHDHRVAHLCRLENSWPRSPRPLVEMPIPGDGIPRSR